MHRLLLLAAVAGAPLQGQEAAPATRAVELITAQDVAHHISVIAHDSMLGRDTPSRGLEMTAQYVADQFKRLGLKPGGDNLAWVTRYRVPGHDRLLAEQTRLTMAVTTETTSDTATVSFATTAHFASDRIKYKYEHPRIPITVLVTGQHTTESVRRADFGGKGILYVPPTGVDAAVRQQVIDQLSAAGDVLLVMSDEDSASFAKQLRAARQQGYHSSEDTHKWAVHMWPEAVKHIVAAAGVNLAQARGDSTAVIRALPHTIEVTLNLSIQRKEEAPTAPNVVGIVEGRDPKLKHQYIVFSAHMDHLGISGGRTDSINNGADDNASGTAGLIELAKAFSQPAARPRRSLIFLAVSGGAKEFWGSRSWWSRLGWSSVVNEPPVANINLDMIGRETRDSIRILGLSDVKLKVPPAWIAAEHPELQLTVVDGGSLVTLQSDHIMFARRLIPSLSFQNGTHEDDRQVRNSLSAIDADQAARIVRLVFYVGRQLADEDEMPRWTPEGRKQALSQR